MEYRIKTEELGEWIENNVKLLVGMKTKSRLEDIDDRTYTIFTIEEWK